MKPSLKLLTHRTNKDGESPLLISIKGYDKSKRRKEISISKDSVNKKYSEGINISTKIPNYSIKTNEFYFNPKLNK